MDMKTLTNIYINRSLKKTMCNLKRLLVSSGKNKRGGMVTNIGLVHACIQLVSRREVTLDKSTYDDPIIFTVHLHTRQVHTGYRLGIVLNISYAALFNMK